MPDLPSSDPEDVALCSGPWRSGAGPCRATGFPPARPRSGRRSGTRSEIDADAVRWTAATPASINPSAATRSRSTWSITVMSPGTKKPPDHVLRAPVDLGPGPSPRAGALFGRRAAHPEHQGLRLRQTRLRQTRSRQTRLRQTCRPTCGSTCGSTAPTARRRGSGHAPTRPLRRASATTLRHAVVAVDDRRVWATVRSLPPARFVDSGPRPSPPRPACRQTPPLA